MPLKLCVGVSKKIGQPHYGSLGASCSVEAELDQALLFADPVGLQQKAELAFAACLLAVEAELERCEVRFHESGDETPPDGEPVEANGSPNGQPRSCVRDWTRKATPNQIRALEALGRRHQVDLTGLIFERHAAEQLADLTIAEASTLIDELQALAIPEGGRSV